MKIRLEYLPDIINDNIGEIELSMELTKEQFKTFKTMSRSGQIDFIKENATVTITDFSVEYDYPELNDWDKYEIE